MPSQSPTATASFVPSAEIPEPSHQTGSETGHPHLRRTSGLAKPVEMRFSADPGAVLDRDRQRLPGAALCMATSDPASPDAFHWGTCWDSGIGDGKNPFHFDGLSVVY